MSKRLEQLLASSQSKKFASEADMTAYLDAERITDPETRIAFKHAMFAAGELGTDQDHGFSLATDAPLAYQSKGPPVSGEMRTWLRKSGLDLAKTYNLREVDDALAASGLGLLERMSLKAELYDRKRIHAAGEITPTPRPGTRELSASTPRRILRDPTTGQPATLKGYGF
jgi:hypothetical protein